MLMLRAALMCVLAWSYHFYDCYQVCKAAATCDGKAAVPALVALADETVR